MGNNTGKGEDEEEDIFIRVDIDSKSNQRSTKGISFTINHIHTFYFL